MGDPVAGSLASALAAVQAELPTIHKGETAEVPTKNGGSYSYTYADLADVSAALMPLLSHHGLSFIAKPTVLDTGVFVLSYSLLHTSGQREDGSYPLPNNGTPQQVGSAITYARRYVLCAVTGVAPEDDDGRAAEQGAREQRQQAAAPAKPGPAKRIQDALSKAGVPISALTAYLGAEHGVEKFGELSGSMQEALADGITKGVLLDDVKRHGSDAEDAASRSQHGDGGDS